MSSHPKNQVYLFYLALFRMPCFIKTPCILSERKTREPLLQCGHISWHKQQAQAQSYQFLPWVCNSGTVVQSLSHVQLFATPWAAACQASQSFTISWSLLKLTSIKPRMPSNHLSPSVVPFSSSGNVGDNFFYRNMHRLKPVLRRI